MPCFRPPFCARNGCPHHTPQQQHPYTAYIEWGSYTTKAFGTVPRFRCTQCGKTFSRQTFRLDYYAKRILEYQDIARRLASTESLSAIGRALRASTDSVSNRISRASRQALAAESELLAQLGSDENLAADGFESFCRSQYFPNNITILVGSSSQYVYAADHATLRRKGRMTTYQKELRATLEELFRPDPKAVENSFLRIAHEALRVLSEGARSPLVLWTDEHPAYPRALARSPHLAQLCRAGVLKHSTISSRAARTTANPLFPVNYLDRELRKDLHEHVRETVCFGRNVNRQMERLTVYLWWHNRVKAHRVRGEPRSHAEMAGFDGRSVLRQKAGIWTQRAWLSLTTLSDAMLDTWLRLRQTPLQPSPDYLPKYASM